MTATIGGVNSARTTTAAEFSLGEIVTNDDGKVYIYIQASEALTANAAVLITEAGASEMVDTTSTASAFGDRVGVVEVAFAINEYGWAIVYGATTVAAGTSAAANTALNSTSTAGELDDDATAGAEVIDGLVATAAESGGTASAFLNFPTVGATL